MLHDNWEYREAGAPMSYLSQRPGNEIIPENAVFYNWHETPNRSVTKNVATLIAYKYRGEPRSDPGDPLFEIYRVRNINFSADPERNFPTNRGDSEEEDVEFVDESFFETH